MLRIKKLELGKFKGTSSTDSLGRCTLLTGPNGSGKTARLAAIQFGVEGKTAIGARPEDSALLGQNGQCGITIELEDGFKWSRRIRRMKATTKTELDVAGQASKSIRDLSPIVAAKCGTFAPQFSIDAFTGLSPDKQRDFVLDLCARAQGGEVDVDALMERIRFAVLREHPEIGATAVAIATESGQTADSLEDRLSPPFRGQALYIYDQIKAEIKGEMTEAIGSALDAAKGIKNASRASATECDSASRKLTERKAEHSVAAGTVADLKEARDKNQADCTELTAQVASQQAREKARVTMDKAIERAASAIAEMEQKHLAMSVELSEVDIPEVDRLVQQSREIAKGMRRENPSETEEHRKAHEAAQENLKQAFASLSQQMNAENDVQTNLLNAQTVLAAIRDSDWARAADMCKHLIENRDFGSEHLNGLASELLALVVKNAQIGDLVNLEQDVVQLETNLATFRATTQQWRDAVTDHQKVVEEAGAAVLRAAEANAKRDVALAEKRVELLDLNRRTDDIRTTHLRISNQIATNRTAIEERKTEQVERERSRNELDSTDGHVPMDQLTEQIQALTATITAIDDELDTKARHAQVDAELNHCIAKAQEMRIRYDVADLVVRAIKALRDVLVADLVKPLLERMDKFFAAGKIDRKAYCSLVTPTGKPRFELGWIADIREVALPALSGGETATFCAALAYALTMLADPPLKLVMIEGGELDEDGLTALLRAVDAVQSDISNALVTTHLPMVDLPPGWGLMSLQRPVVEQVI